ncbi:MAG: M56 family metallopeptidase [Verrucomicrobiales bacterium]|nr:M56 family metallopeptidase [Verrucomicrobiales bacterium]
METFLAGLDATAAAVLRCSLQATVLILVLLAIRWLSGKHLSAAGRGYLWWIVAGRLLLPWSPGAPFSLFGVVDVRSWTTAGIHSSEASAPETTGFNRSPPRPFHDQTASIVEPVSVSEAPGPDRASAPLRLRGAWRLLAGVWALGVLAVLGITVVETARMHRWVRIRTTHVSPETSALWEECRQRMGVHGPIALRVGTWVRSPAVWGFWRPTFLLPADLESRVCPARLRHILLHEAAHLARHDLRWGLLLRLVQALHWFNPVVPWLLRRMRLEREIATDAKVLGVTGAAESSVYGETLLMLLAGGTTRASSWGRTTVGTTDAPADMEERLRAIAIFTPRTGTGRVTTAFAVILAMVCWTDAATSVTPEKGSDTSPNLASAAAFLPKGEELGPGWSNRVTSLVDRGTPALEYFDPGVFEPARVLVRSHVPEGSAFCDMSYFRDGQLVFDAWLRRKESTDSVADEWNRLRHGPLLPRLSDGKETTRHARRVGKLEALLYEQDSRTLWMASGRWILNLNLQGKVSAEEAFSMAEVFARRLEPGPSTPAPPTEGTRPPEEGAWYVVHSLGDAYTPVRRVHTNRVALSRAFRKPDGAQTYFTITNSESVPILIWNVRVQRMTDGSDGSPPGWETVSSDYPSCVSGIPAGATGDTCVLPPSRARWRVALLYTAQSLDGRPIPDFPAHLQGDHEILSAPEEPAID